MEPPVVAPDLYKALPRITAVFDRVYVHNTRGDGYSLEHVDQTKLRRLYWPIPHDDVSNAHWQNEDRLKRVVVINGNHRPLIRDREQYSVRIKAMSELSEMGVVDLYGTGWHRWWSRTAMWMPYWRNIGSIKSIYRGTCASKFDVLKQYQFSLCFENMLMDGYITEKIFDCLYAGAIPLYQGASNITDYIPSDSFVDARQYSTWKDMWRDISTMPPKRMAYIRACGRDFLRSDSARMFFNSMQHICED
jgi:hypothetical protein